MMAKAKQEQFKPEQLHEGEVVCVTLQELAARFNFNDPYKFRNAVLMRNLFPYKRVSRARWKVRTKDLPR